MAKDKYERLSDHELGNLALEMGWDSEGGVDDLEEMTRAELLAWIREHES